MTAQLPQNDELFLDHAGYFVPDIDACADGFERLGFAVSGVNTHFNQQPDGSQVKSGTANRLIVLERGYIEVLGKVADTPLGRQLNVALERYAGVHLVALAHADVVQREERLRAAGIELQPTVTLQRPVETEDGERQARFTVVRTAPGVFPEGRVQMMTHHTPELVWLPGVTRHPNRATALTGLLLAQDDVDAAAARWQRFTGIAATHRGHTATMALDRATLAFCDRRNAGELLPHTELPPLPYGAVLSLASDDLGETAVVLARNGITPGRREPGWLLVAAADAMGTAILFHAPEVDGLAALLRTHGRSAAPSRDRAPPSRWPRRPR